MGGYRGDYPLCFHHDARMPMHCAHIHDCIQRLRCRWMLVLLLLIEEKPVSKSDDVLVPTLDTAIPYYGMQLNLSDPIT